MAHWKRIFCSTPGALLAVGLASLLFIGGIAACGGGLMLPFYIRTQRAVAQREEAEQAARQARDAMHNKAGQEAAENQNAAPDDGNSTESAERE